MVAGTCCKPAKWCGYKVNIKKQVGIFGVSGMAREAGDIAHALGLTPLYVAINRAEAEKINFLADVILERELTKHSDIEYVIGIGDNKIRKSVFERYNGQLSFRNLIHPSATFGIGQLDALENRQGIIVSAGVRFTSGITTGDFNIFNQNASVAHDCIVGNYVHVAPGANVSGYVDLQEGCWIGAGAVINQGCEKNKLNVGANTIIGSGAVVIADCEPDSVYVGVPAKRIK